MRAALGNLGGALIVGVAILLGAVIYPTVHGLLAEPGGGAGTERLRDEIAELRREVAALGEQVDAESRRRRTLEAEVLRLAERTPDLAPAPAGAGDTPVSSLVDQLALSRGRFNEGLSSPRRSYLTVVLGEPRGAYSDDCQMPTNPRLLEMVETRDMGPFTVTMITPALDSLARVLERLRREEPAVYRQLGTAGGLCARFVRGSATAVSNHSWGLAIDITVAGRLDAMGDGGTQFALLLLAEYFNEEGWYWGAEYGREDSMHFEVSDQTLRRWVEQGLL